MIIQDENRKTGYVPNAGTDYKGHWGTVIYDMKYTLYDVMDTEFRHAEERDIMQELNFCGILTRIERFRKLNSE